MSCGESVDLKTNFVLIDLENVQPKNLEILKRHNFRVIVFVGDKQTKISFELASAMQSLGSNAEYVKIEGNGLNALDFHIAFYIGHIAQNGSNSYFHIISKDTGFDPLIKHLKNKKIYAQRHTDIAEIPLLKIASSTTKIEKVNEIIDFLTVRGSAKPRTVQTLSNSINMLFMKKLEESELSELVEELIKQKIVIQGNNKISYKLPDEAITTC